METSSELALEVPIVSARYARRFVRFMEHRGVKRHTILANTGITDDMLNNPDASLSMHQVMDLLRQADWLMTDERAAFEFGQQLDLPSHGLLGFAMLGQENPRRLVSMIVQYLRVGLPLMDMELESTGSTFRIRLIDTWGGVEDLRPCLTKSIWAAFTVSPARFAATSTSSLISRRLPRWRTGNSWPPWMRVRIRGAGCSGHHAVEGLTSPP